MLITSILSPTFLTGQNLGNVADRISPLSIVALAQTVCVLSGGIDLSLGANVSLATVILSFTGRGGTLAIGPALLVCLLTGMTAGLANGIGIVHFNLPPLIMTLSSSVILQGISLHFREIPGGSVDMAFCDALGERIGFIPVRFMLALVLYAAVWWFPSFTKFGRHIYAVGGNAEFARRSGINPTLVRIGAHTIAGVLGATGGIMLAARVYSGDPVIGAPLGMDSVAATIVGGTSFPGGIGGAVGTLAGAALMAMMSNLLNMLNIYVHYQYILRGLILCGALVIYHARRKAGAADAH